ncbi:hypothetical protein JKF63_00882 [Porcisia hertigi]|uniref:Uncharacterized protein n=1 Tax=Porcisia hertigi TaxID=2761500 RepID=A0A836L1G3_9TRYP|nr:hypothetical protein JKF63_00882 [Porcisia hertigi]
MEQAHKPTAVGLSASSATATSTVAAKALTDRSRIEDRIARALERAEAFFPVFSSPDSANWTNSAVDGGGEGVLATSAAKLPPRDAAVEVSHTSEGDQAASGLCKVSMPTSDDGLAPALQQRALRAKDNEIGHLRRTVQELSRQLHSALIELDQRSDTSAELQVLKKACEVGAAANEREMRNARLEMLESRVKYRIKEEQLATTYTADVHAKAAELLEPHTKEVHDSNFELLKEKLMLAQELTKVRADYSELNDKYVRLKRETDIGGGVTREMLQRSICQKDEIAALRLQVKASEDKLDIAVAKYEKELLAERKSHRDALELLTRERDDARRDAVQLQRELTQLRGAASNLLAQRSELEKFFHAALAEVRESVVAERRRALLENMPAGRVTNPRQALPAHTNSSLLRLEGFQRLMLTDSEGPAPLTSSSPTTGWSLDRKGFPKRITAASSSARHPKSGVAALFSKNPIQSTAHLGGPAPANSQPSPPADVIKNSSVLVALSHSTPPYLRLQEHHTPSLLITARDRCVGVGTSGSQREPCTTTSLEDGAPFRLGKTPDIPGCSPPPLLASPEHCRLVDTFTTGETPLPQPLPTTLTWQDVKKVEVTDLCWADKERVIQLLFKRIRQEGQRHARMSHHANSQAGPLATKLDPIAPVEELPCDAAQVDHDLLTFLTQQ